MKFGITKTIQEVPQKAVLTGLLIALSAPAFASNLERQHGFAPGQVTAHQLAVLEAVKTSEDDLATYDFKREQFANGTAVSTQGGVSSGHAQMAASYGLDPAEYTVAEIVVIAGESDEEERDRLIAAYKGNGTVTSTQSSGNRPCNQFELAAKIDQAQCGTLTHNEVAKALVAQTSSD